MCAFLGIDTKAASFSVGVIASFALGSLDGLFTVPVGDFLRHLRRGTGALGGNGMRSLPPLLERGD